MHRSFADWYRVCTVNGAPEMSPELLKRRWAGVEDMAAFVNDDAEDNVFDVVRILLQSTPSEPCLSRFQHAFKDADSTFPLVGNQLELSVLAGSVLASLMEDGAWEGDRAALAIACAAATEHVKRHDSWITPFVEVSNSHLRERLLGLRQSGRRPPVGAPEKIVTALNEAITSISTSAKDVNLIPDLADGEIALSKLMHAANSAIETLSSQLALAREESDVLWWLLSESSRDLHVGLESLDRKAVPVIAGKELADIVEPPGAFSTEHILRRVLSGTVPKTRNKSKDDSCAIADSINAIPKEWRAAVAGEMSVTVVEDLCPLLSAIRHSITTEGATEWIPAYRKASRCDPLAVWDRTDIAYQIHKEWLLARMCSDT